MSLLPKVKSGIWNPDWHVFMFDIDLQKLQWLYWPGHAGVVRSASKMMRSTFSLLVHLCVCLSLSVCLFFSVYFISLPISLSVCMSLSVYLCVLSLCLYVFICFSLSVYSLCMFVFLCFSLSVYFLSVYSLSLCLYVSVCFNLYTNSVSLSLSLSLHFSLFLSLLSVPQSVYIYRVELCDCLFCSPRTSCTVALTTPLMCGRHRAASSRLARLTTSAAQSTRWPSPSCLSSQVIQVGTTGFGFLWTVHYYR